MEEFMKFRKFLTYSLASVCLLSAIPYLPARAITLEQLSTDAESIDVYFNDDGENLSTLNKESITATLDGNPLTVEDFAQSEQRINYMFLLDISGSVPEEYMVAAKEQILSIYANLDDQDLLSVITFGDDVHTIIEGTETLDEVRAILDTVHCDNDYTHFYDAVDLMLSRLEGISDMRNVAVVVSDGINTGDVNTSVASLRSRLSGSGIAIYALAVDAASPSAIGSFRDFVQLSGGQLFEFNPQNCASSMSSLTESVEKIWNVGIQVDPALITGQAQSLVIQMGDYGTIEQEVVLEQRIVDTTAPTITNWEINPETNTLALYFSEPMADLKNPEHYIITGPNENLAPVTVVEHTENYVLLMIDGFDNMPGWRAEFSRLMDASPNRNLLESDPLLITPEIIDVPEVPEEPVIDKKPGFDFAGFILEYWQLILAAGILLLVLIFYIVFKPSRKKDSEEDGEERDFAEEAKEDVKHEKLLKRSRKRAKQRAHILARKRAKKQKEALAEFDEDGIAVSETNGPAPERAAKAAPVQEEEEEHGKAPRAKRVRVHWLHKDAPELEEEELTEEVAVNELDPKQAAKAPKRRRGLFRWFRRSAPIDETEIIEEANDTTDEQATVNENYMGGGGVSMSKGMAHMGAAPTKDTSGSASSEASDERGDVHVSEHKRERRGLFGWFRRSSSTEEVAGDDDLGVAVNEPLRGVHAPTRKDESAKEDEYEVDMVSNHRKNRKVKRVRKGWFTWRKKEIPEAQEAPVTEEAVEDSIENAEEAAALAAAETGEEVSEKTARKYIKTKKKWWKRKKKDAVAETESEEAALETEEAEESDTEDNEIDKKTARKYIKPRKTWFKKKMKPMIEQDIPERVETAPVDTPVAADNTVTAPVAAPTEEVKPEPPKRAPIQGGAIKSGGFSLSGISTDYRPSIFSFGDNKLKNVKYAKSEKDTKVAKEEKPKQDFFPKKNQTNPSLGGSVRTTTSSSRQKNVSFTFGDKKKK